MADATVAPTEPGTVPVAVETEAPVVETTPEVPVEVEKPEPLSRREAKHQMSTDRAQRQAKADVEARLAAAAAEPAAEPVVEGAETPEVKPAEGVEGEPPAEGAAEEPKPEDKPTEGFTVQLNPRNPGMQGLSSVTVASEVEARMIANLVSGYTRKGEVVSYKRRMNTAEEQSLEDRQWRIQKETIEKVESDWRGTQQYKASVEQYNDIKERVGEDAAEKYWQGELARLKDATAVEYDQRVQLEADAEADRQGDAWAQRVWERARLMPEYVTRTPNFSNLFQQATASFNAELEMGHMPDVTADNADDQFMGFFNKVLLRDSAVLAATRAQREQMNKSNEPVADTAAVAEREREAIRKEAVEQHMKELAANRREGPPHPLGNLGGVHRDTTPEAGPEANAPDNRTPSQVKKDARRGAREDARRRLGG